MALYKNVIRQVHTPKGRLIRSTFGVKKGCPVSPTLFGLYIDEISYYINKGGDRGASSIGVWIMLLLYADDIVLITDSHEGLQKHLDALHTFALDKDLICQP